MGTPEPPKFSIFSASVLPTDWPRITLACLCGTIAAPNIQSVKPKDQRHCSICTLTLYSLHLTRQHQTSQTSDAGAPSGTKNSEIQYCTRRSWVVFHFFGAGMEKTKKNTITNSITSCLEWGFWGQLQAQVGGLRMTTGHKPATI